MNKDRRERLSDVSSTIDEAIDQIQEIIDEEQEAFDNLPDSLQCSDRGQKMDDAINDMCDLIGQLEVFEVNLSIVVNKCLPKKTG